MQNKRVVEAKCWSSSSGVVSALQSGHNSLAIPDQETFLPFFAFSSSKVARSPDDRVQVEADHLLARGLHLQEGRRRDGDVHRVLRSGPGEQLCFCDSDVQFCRWTRWWVDPMTASSL